MFDIAYRIWLLKYLLGLFFPPATLLYVLSKTVAAGTAPWGFLGIGCFVISLLSTPIYWLIAGRVREWQDARHARECGAQVIPVIKGKRFGDVDLIER